MSADAIEVASAPRRRGRHGFSFSRLGAWLTALALIAAGVLVMVNEHSVRVFEARNLVMIANDVLGSEAVLAWKDGNPSIAFPVGESWVLAIVTIQCAIALYLGPIAFLAGLLALRRGVRLHRVLLATAAGVVGMMALSLIRLGLLVFAWSTWGIDAFRWIHGPVGTVLMLLGMAAALILMVVVAFKRPVSQARGRRAATPAQTTPDD